ncbi:Uncharacterised protein [uncultured archaeon]|nr:Uncharacterised protein [uncultured archaeon]
MKNETAVSPVIGTILMVAITVILAAVIAVFGFSFGISDQKGPTASIILGNVPETIGIIDMKITHNGGDRLKAGDWKISIVPAGEVPVYRTSSTDFQAGDMIITTNLTNDNTGLDYVVTNKAVYTTSGDPPHLIADQKYEVKIIVYPYKTLVTDGIVSVR